MEIVRSKEFANGKVYALQLGDGALIETTDTFLPFYTKDAAGHGTNELTDYQVGDRNERWLVGVSTMSGCPVGCKFCATGQMNGWRNLTSAEIMEQVFFIVNQHMPTHRPRCSGEFKINYTRMGEPFLNEEALKRAVTNLKFWFPKAHHYVSTIGLRGSDFTWIYGNITLQISLHSLDEKRRQELIPVNNLMTLKELGQIRVNSKQKITLNLTLVDEADFDIEKLKYYFDPAHFFCKLSPINTNVVSDRNGLGAGIIEAVNLV